MIPDCCQNCCNTRKGDPIECLYVGETVFWCRPCIVEFNSTPGVQVEVVEDDVLVKCGRVVAEERAAS